MDAILSFFVGTLIGGLLGYFGTHIYVTQKKKRQEKQKKAQQEKIDSLSPKDKKLVFPLRFRA